MAQRLTERENQILTAVASGLTSIDIAKVLRISAQTVEAHKNNIKKKLNCPSIALLTQAAIVLGLIVPSLPDSMHITTDKPMQRRKSK